MPMAHPKFPNLQPFEVYAQPKKPLRAQSASATLLAPEKPYWCFTFQGSLRMII